MARTRYVWDRVADTYLMEKDEAGTTQVAYTSEPIRYGSMVSQRKTVASYHHHDGQYSTRVLTSSAQAVTDTYTYTAFGQLVHSSGSTDNPFRYNGSVQYYY